MFYVRDYLDTCRMLRHALLISYVRMMGKPA